MTLKDICEILNTKVSFDRFRPVEMIAYGIIGTIGTGVLVYMLSTLFK